MGMPPDGTMSGADPAGSVSDVNVPQTPVMVSPGGGFGVPLDPNRVTTKPRQQPGGGSGSGGFDPAMNGSEGGPDSPLSPEPSGGSDDSDDSGGSSDAAKSTQASAWRTAALAHRRAKMVRQILAENPEVSRHEARMIADETLTEYPMVVQADWHGLEWGNRAGVPDAGLTTYVKKGPGPGPGEGQAPEGQPPHPVEQHPGAAQHVPSGVQTALPAVRHIMPGGVSGEMAAASEVAADGAGLARFLPLLAGV